MGIGIGAVIGGISAIAGAFKKSNAASSIPAAPAYPELSPELKARVERLEAMVLHGKR